MAIRLKRLSTIFVEKETSVGVDAKPDYTNTALQVSDLDLRLPTEFAERDILNASLSQFGGIPTSTNVELTFSLEAKGSGVVGVEPRIGKCIEACLFKKTVSGNDFIYKPSSDVNCNTTATFHVIYGNVLYKVVGTVGSFNFEGSVGNFGKFNFTFNGKLKETISKGINVTAVDTNSDGTKDALQFEDSDLADALRENYFVEISDGNTTVIGVVSGISGSTVTVKAYPTGCADSEIDYDSWVDGTYTVKDNEIDVNLSLISSIVTYEDSQPEPFQDTNFTFDGQTIFVATRFSFDIANTLAKRQSINEKDGVAGFIVSERKPTGSFDPEATQVYVYDMFNKFKSGAEVSLSAVIGDTAGNKITITAPKVQISEVTYADRDGVLTNDVTLRFNRDAGDDEIVITFS